MNSNFLLKKTTPSLRSSTPLNPLSFFLAFNVVMVSMLFLCSVSIIGWLFFFWCFPHTHTHTHKMQQLKNKCKFGFVLNTNGIFIPFFSDNFPIFIYFFLIIIFSKENPCNLIPFLLFHLQCIFPTSNFPQQYQMCIGKCIREGEGEMGW